MNALKGLSTLTDVYPKETLKDIVVKYADTEEEMDYRLRIGECFRQIIQRSGQVFADKSKRLVDL